MRGVSNTESKRELNISDLVLFRFAYQYVKKYRLYLILSGVLLVFGSVINLLPELLIRKILDEDIVNRDTSALLNSVIIMISIYIVSYAIRFANNLVTTRSGQGTVYDLRSAMFTHLLHQDQSYFDKNQSGRINSKLTNDLDTLANFFSSGLVDILASIVQLIAIIWLMLYLDVMLALISFSMIPMLIAISFFMKGPIRKISQKRRKSIANVTSNIAENINGAKVSKSFAREKINKKEFEKINKENYRVSIKATSMFALIFPMIGLITAIGTSLILIYSGYQVTSYNNSKYTIGLVATFMAYLSRFFSPVFTLSMFYSTYQSALASLERVYEFINEPIKIIDKDNALQLSVKDGTIEFKNVNFSYNQSTPIFTDLNVSITGKTTVAIVGSTGAGKSSFIKLISRFYDTNNGDIFIDNQRIKDLTLKSLRESIGLVPQKPTMFNSTILHNIKYGNPQVDLDKIIEVSKIVGIHDFINSLPKKYETLVSEGGKNLSMGQRQLISFARAIIKNPEILIFDEATSSLDVISEIRIQKALEKIIENRTVIIIAHRLSTVRKADRILVMENGQIIQNGKHKELLSMEGRYKELYLKQFLEEDN